MLISLIRPALRLPLRLALLSSSAAFDPSILFANGEQGAWYDPSDRSTLFQDAEGTIPVTADGDPVGLMLDKSGNGNHLTQAATSARPTFRTDGALHWLEPDGVDDAMATPQFAWGTDKATIVHGSYRADEDTRIIFEFSPSVLGNFGTFYVASKSGGVANWASSSRGTAGNSSGQAAYVNIAGPDTAVITATHDIAASLTRVRRNGVYGVDGVGDKGTGNFRSAQLFMFARGGGSLFFNGRFYGAILINRILSADEVVAAETWMAAKAGVTL